MTAKRIAALMEERIRSGAYRSGDWLPTERDLALEMGVSRPVIRRTLALLEEEGWIDRTPGRRPSVSPRPPAAKPTLTAFQTIAAVFPHSTNPANIDLMRGIHRALRMLEMTHHLIVFDTGGDHTLRADRERDALEAVARDGIAGIILWQIGGQSSEDALRLLHQRNIPVVCVDRYPLHIPCDFVGVDNRAGARTAMEYLLGLGHRRIAHLTLAENSPESCTSAIAERRQGFADALAECGFLAAPGMLFSDVTRLAASLAAASPDSPSAVFAATDHLAEDLLAETEKHGLSIPKDFSLIGFDDLARHWHRRPSLTSMGIAFDDIGERAAELLLRRISAAPSLSPAHQHILLPTPLISRASCQEFVPRDPST